MSNVFGVSLPETWNSTRLKNIASRINRGSTPDYIEDGPVRVIGQAANQDAALDWTRTRCHDFTGDPTTLKGSLDPGDILVNSTGTGTLGRVGFFQGPPDQLRCVADSHITILRTEKSAADPRFIYYWLRSRPFYDYIYSALVVGATNQIELSREGLANAPAPIPPLAEQRRIADFLDSETSCLDLIVEKRQSQKQLIEDSAIARAYDGVRGAGVPVGRTASGLTWLGTVPDTWRVAAVSHLFEVELGKMLNQERASGTHLRPYLRCANVQWDRIDTTEILEMNFPPEEQSRYRLRDGDLLVCEGGSWPGRAAIWRGDSREMYYQKALHRLRPHANDSVRWLYYCLYVAEKMRVFAIQGNSATITHLTRDQLRSQRFPFPDPKTQRCIADELDKAADVDRRLADLLDQQIRTLRDRREALITAAVTGEFDVSTASDRGVTE